MDKARNSTKRSFITSLISLVVCITMLLGTTFAWFTDTASSKGNKIVAGKLDVQLLMSDADGNYTDISQNASPIFGTGSIAQNNNSETLWEPGKTQVAYLAIKNKGNLALKYKVSLDVKNISNDMYKAMEYAIIPDAQAPGSVTGWTSGNSVSPGTQTVSGDVSLPVGGTHYFALAVHMKEEAGNEYQEGEVDFDLTVYATQDTVESDSFNNQYDANAKYPVSVSTDEEIEEALVNKDEEIINISLDNDVTVRLDDYYNTTLGGPNTKVVTINGNGHTLTFDASYRNAINANGKLILNDVVLDSTYMTGGSTWDDYDLLFRKTNSGGLVLDELVLNNVTANRAIAIESGIKANMNGVKINQTAATGDMYALWICAGADVTLTNCEINSINPSAANRAIKIADEYITDPQITKLSVSGTTFKSQKKAAVLVTSTAGAEIIWGTGNDISQVQADSTNAVWVDEDRAGYFDLVSVTGCTKKQE